MKKKILLMVVMAFVLACVMAFAVNAEESVHNGKVDLNATVTLNDGTVCQLFDSEGNALIWYKNSAGELLSIRADDERVKYKATYGFSVGNSTVGTVYVYEVSDMWIALESGNVSKGNIVVLNLMDDDVKVNEGGSGYIGGPVNCVKTIQWANKILEYAYLRLDTAAIQLSAFNGCTALKYVNLEDLTELRQISGGSSFSGSTALFAGQVLDLTKTKITNIGGNGTFNNVPMSGIKFPSTLTSIAEWNLQGSAITSISFPTGVASIEGSQFNDCKSLKEICINYTTTKIKDRAFNNTVLEKIYFVGTLEQLNTLLDNTGTGSNAPFWDVVGENRANLISYADYLKLEDKSGKYVVYNYSYCEAYNDGNHTPSAEDTMVFNGYFDKVIFASLCTVDGCSAQTVNEEKTIGEMFVYLGYSYTETAINGSYSMSQFYGINKENIAKYADVTGNEVVYGFVISSIENPIGNENANENNVILSESGKFVYDYASIKITGITENNTNKGVVFCMYVIDGDEVSYLDNGTTSQEVACKSYNDVIALENAKKEVK